MKDFPLITALITTHNRPHLLPRAIESVTRQTYPNIQLVVVDDGSKEDAGIIVKQFSDVLPVKFHRNNVSKGACASRNTGISLADGVFIAGLDDDDEWMPTRLEKLYNAYADEYSFSTSDIFQVYTKRTLVWKKKSVITLHDLLFSNQVGNQGLIKKERLEEVGGFDETLVAAQDYDLWIRLCERYGNVINVREPLQKVYLQHSGNQITRPENQLKGYLQFYNKHASKMNYAQKKYQLFKIRKATGKVNSLFDLIGWVPFHKLWKETKVYIGQKLV